VIETRGLFCSLYSHRVSHFFVTRKAGEKVDPHRLTRVGRALKEPGIQMFPAYSPQARGRSERNFGTWQNRLPQELRLAGLRTVEEANRFLRERYISEFNLRFAQAAAEKGTAFQRCRRVDLDEVSVQTPRLVGQDKYGDHRRSVLAIGIPAHAGRLYGNHLRTPGWPGVGALGAARGGLVRLRRASSGKQKPPRRGKDGSVEAGENHKQVFTGSPHSLGNLAKAARFPLSHRADDGGSGPKTKARTKAAHAA
jgi:hypothetical protein